MKAENASRPHLWQILVKAICAHFLVAVFAVSSCVFSQAHGSIPQELIEIENALRTGDYAQALQLSQIALAKSPQDYRIWTLRGMAFSSAGKPVSALAAFQHALQVAPDYLPALEGAAQIEYHQPGGKPKPLLEKIVTIDPSNVVAHTMLAWIAYRGHNCPSAIEHFRYLDSRGVLQTPSLSAYGSCLIALGRFADAVPIFTRVATSAPNETNKYNLALAQWEAGNAKDALATLQPLLDIGTTDEDTLTLAADIEESTGQTEKAIALLRTAILANPQKVDAYLHFATLASNHKSYQVGVDMVNAGLTQIPGSAPLYLVRGILNSQMGRQLQSMADFEAAAKFDPQLTFLGTAESIADEQSDNFALAIGGLRAQLKKHPDDALAQFMLAELLVTLGKPKGSPEYQEEVEAANRSLKLDPKLADAHDLLAGLYLQSGEINSSIEESEAALKIDPADQHAVYHMILALRNTDRKGEIPEWTRRLVALRATASQSKLRPLIEVPGEAQKETARP